MKLIEILEPEFEILEAASEKNGGRMKVRSLLTRANFRNQNGRVYPEKILTREMAKLETQVAKNAAFMSADHTKNGKSTIQDTAAMLTGITRKNNDWYGDITILNTQKGRDVAELLNAGGRVGCSSRGAGSIKSGSWNREKADIIGNDYSLKAFDLVLAQSVEGADFKLDEGICIFESRDEEDPDGGGNMTFEERLQEELEKRKEEITNDVIEHIESNFDEEVLEKMYKGNREVFDNFLHRRGLINEIRNSATEQTINERVEQRLTEEREELAKELKQTIIDGIATGEYSIPDLMEQVSEETRQDLEEVRQRKLAGIVVGDKQPASTGKLTVEQIRQRQLLGLDISLEQTQSALDEDEVRHEAELSEDEKLKQYQRVLAGLPPLVEQK